jgi:hypothetical protein
MGGGLMQLVAYGAQDIYLTGNPQITFFKVVYRRHTNFSMEAIEQTWNGTSTGNGRCTATISRNGDLVHRMYLEITGPRSGAVCNPGSSWIDTVELEIGGQRIDKHSGQWLEVWAQLTRPNHTGVVGLVEDAATNETVVFSTLEQKVTGQGGIFGETAVTTAIQRFHIPLQFWFCRNPGLALPLIALQYHEVKVILEHTLDTTFSGSGTAPTNQLWCDYIYLDTDERRRFAQVSHEYLIEQVQEQSYTASSTDLNFNHPVKELIASTKGNFVNKSAVTTKTPLTGTPLLKLNGHDRFAARDISYFTRVQVKDYHSGAGGLNTADAVAASDKFGGQGRHFDGIFVYSFALKPEEHQPSGTCNFSRIDNAQLSGFTAAPDTVFAVNYNVLRIMSGMGGLAYSN